MNTDYYTESPYTEDNDNIVGTKVALQHNVELQQGEVMNRKRDSSEM